MITVIPIIDRDELNVKTMVLTLDVEEGINVIEAVRKACTEYCKTEEGRKTYIGNCDNFNWGDFEAYVPNDICGKYGIRKIDSFMCEDELDFNEQLVDEEEVLYRKGEINSKDLCELYNSSDIDTINYLIENLEDEEDVEKAKHLYEINMETSLGNGREPADKDDEEYYHKVFWELLNKYGVTKMEDGRACIEGEYYPSGV